MIRKIFYPALVVAVLCLFTAGCSEKEGLIEIAINDVSSRITNLPASVGLGAEMTITGTQLQELERLIFGEIAIRKVELEVTTSTITLTVPVTAALGQNEVVLVFPGADRAFTSVTVVAP